MSRITTGQIAELLAQDKDGRVTRKNLGIFLENPDLFEEREFLPTEMTVGGRTYEILGFLKEGEDKVTSHVMVKRAEEMNANLGQDDGEHILKYQDDIPVVLRGKVVFVFPGWRHPDFPGDVCVVCWRDGRWVGYWRWLGVGWRGRSRLLRRK